MSTLTTTTSTNRPNLGTGDVGKSYFETDSNKILVWDGTAWNEWNSDLVLTPGFNNNFSTLLDGTDDYIDCGNDSGLNLTSAFTLSAWVKQTTADDNMVLFRRTGANGYQIRLNSGTFNYYGGTGDRNFTTGLTSTTAWYHLVVTHTGSSVTGYVDGSTAGSSYSESIAGVATADFLIGKHGTSPTNRYFNGYIDEVSVWDTALSSSAVSDLYNSGTPSDLTGSSNLVGWWRMGDYSGDTDSSGGNPNDGDTIGTVKNAANAGTHDGSGSGGALYKTVTP